MQHYFRYATLFPRDKMFNNNKKIRPYFFLLPIFWGQHFWGGPIFSAPNFFLPNFFWPKFFWPTFFFDRFFLPEIFFVSNFFRLKFFFDPNSFVLVNFSPLGPSLYKASQTGRYCVIKCLKDPKRTKRRLQAD